MVLSIFCVIMYTYEDFLYWSINLIYIGKLFTTILFYYKWRGGGY